MGTHQTRAIEVEHREGARSAVIYAHGGWSAGGFMAFGDGKTNVPAWTDVVFLAADRTPAIAPGPQRLVTGALDEQIVDGMKMQDEIMFSSVAKAGSSIKNYHISRRDESDIVAETLNRDRPQEKVWALILPVAGRTPRLSEVFADLVKLKLQYKTLFYAACRVDD